MKKGAIITSIFMALALIITFVSSITEIIINIQWFKELGYLSVYFTKLTATLKIFIPTFIITFLGIWVYYKNLKSNLLKNSSIIENPNSYKREKRIFVLVNTLFSGIIAYIFSEKYWYYILQFNNSVKFNINDPIFNKDISFYIFKMPFLQSIYSAIITLLFVLIIITLAFYFIIITKEKMEYGGIKGLFNNKENIKKGINLFAGKQLAVLSALILISISIGFLLKSWNLVYSERGVAYGASYTDVKVSILFYKLIIIVSLISSVVVFVCILKSKWKPIIISLALIVFLVIGEGITVYITENFIVKSNQKTLEEPYIKYNIDYTRKAFKLDNIKEIPFEVKNNLTSQDMKNNRETVENIRINAFEPALEFYNQYQTIRPYYIFNDMDIDRYKINNKYTQVFLAPREINLKNIEPNTWQNRHLIYTHGYGLSMSKVNSVTNEGQPSFVIKDIPSINDTDIKLDNPRVYFGEKTNDYAVVDTKLKEFDYPQGSSNKISEYQGNSGIKMTFANRLLFALNKRDINFLTSRDITSDSKILINRNILDRVNKIAPFLTYDKDPYVVVNDGKLYWIIDAYTTSNRYPYSQPYNNVNYIRSSIKVIVDAYEGDVSFYIVDKEDPIALSYSKIFPGLFKDISTIPANLKDHFKYPEDIFRIQSKVLEKYHMTDTMAFLNGDDLWEVSKNEKTLQNEKSVDEAPYVVMKLQGQEKEEMMIMEYFNMKSRNTMSSMLGARMDNGNLGELVMYRFPSNKTIYSPYFFKQKLKQDPVISKELSLWGTGGSEVIFGDTIIVPINNSLIYIESLYLRASGKNSAPEVKRIILSYGDKVVLAENIESGIKQLFNFNEEDSSVNVPSDNKNNNNELLDNAKSLYNKAIESQRNGDWAKYGEYINQLGKLLNDMK
ncbi:UPF0182 family protein [Clostridium peptidivorans]|uniref:UPF0182 family protein n=1 Tax=Clostridium peptidivorans TaxID=100174 RepID=UPI000BE2982E|nr:UPF0182 family protein [Clostridium peptidivorans]